MKCLLMATAIRNQYPYFLISNLLFSLWVCHTHHPLFCFFIIVTKSQQQQQNINHTTTTLSEARSRLAATSSGELVFFGGGFTSIGPSDRVDIYNVTSGSWTTATLSIPRYQLAATSSQNLVFFGGGWNGTSTFSNRVDIYNTLNGSWSTATLSQPRFDLAATSVGNFVLFGGGFSSISYSKVVDVFDVTNNTWTTATLSQARAGLASTSVDNRYALFGGGLIGSGPLTNVVDIFDSLSGMWNTTTLSQARYLLAATSLGNLAFFGGGRTSGNQPSNVVDIFNSTSQTWSTSTLSQARYQLASSSIGEFVAFGGGWNGSTVLSVVDMLNVTSNTWFTVNLSQPRYYLVSTSSTIKIFFGGGERSSSQFSDAVDIFDFTLIFFPLGNTSVSSPSSTSNQTPSSTPSLSTSFPSPIFPASSFLMPNFSPTLDQIPAINQQTNDTTNQTNINSDNTDVIIGVLIGLVAVLIVAVSVTILLIVIKRFKQKKKQNLSQSKEQQWQQSTDNTQIGGRDIINMKELSKKSVSISESQSSIKASQISFKDLTVEKEIGEGSFGKVCLGKWNSALVALKFCRKKGNLEDFMREAQIMIGLPPHPNVVQMFGVSVDGPEAVLILEYCAGGSLDTLLFDEQVEVLTEEEMMRLVRGIAAGMLHLHKHNIVHRDLAARNILLTSGGEPKISDFGMSRVLERDEGKTYNNVGPIRWMAPESIKQKVYSKQSDVWSFGIVVWEIVAQSEPHVDVDPVEVGVLIRDKELTPKIPNECPPLLRQIMEMCWKQDPNQRPTFETICAMLDNNKIDQESSNV